MVTPVPALILTLSPGLTKPTLVPFACKIQPLALIASTTFLVFTKYLPSPSVVQGLPSFAFSPFLILETLALNLKSLPERTTSMVSVSEKETVSPPLTDWLVLSEPSLIFHAAAFWTAVVFILIWKFWGSDPGVGLVIVIDPSGEVTEYFLIAPATAFNWATFTASESALPAATLIIWRVLPESPTETAPLLPLMVFLIAFKAPGASTKRTGA